MKSINDADYQRLKTKEDLRKLVAELKHSNRELESFAYINSHDLQEPLRSIISYAQLIEMRYKGQLDSDADEFIDFMVGGALRMKDMIQGLLDYSRVGTQGGEFKDFSAEEVLSVVSYNLKVSIEECRAEITHDPLPVIFADESQITRVFQNLIWNALKFRKEGIPPEIHVSARKDENNNEYVFSVSDKGIGLEEQYFDRIFEVFKRLHTIDEYKGAGIGLAIVKRVIDRHGGRVWVESKLGRGSTFYFTIPMDKK
jgi:light-regulated signal transduction histidine kinase (bacteriophytochrome)